MTKLLFLFLTFAAASAAFAQTAAASNAPFLMPVEDTFHISGRGVVATGQIERGSVKTGDVLELVGEKGVKEVRIAGIEKLRKMLDSAAAGDNVGLLLKGVEKSDVERGMLITKPGSIKLYSKFKARIDLLPAAEGGRKAPVASGFRPQVLVRLASHSAVLTLAKNKKDIAPGEKGVPADVELTTSAPLEIGQRISIREFGKTIGTAVVQGLDVKK